MMGCARGMLQQCGKDVPEVLPAGPLDLAGLTARQVAELYPEAAAEIDAHEHRCRAIAVVNANGRK